MNLSPRSSPLLSPRLTSTIPFSTSFFIHHLDPLQHSHSPPQAPLALAPSQLTSLNLSTNITSVLTLRLTDADVDKVQALIEVNTGVSSARSRSWGRSGSGSRLRGDKSRTGNGSGSRLHNRGGGGGCSRGHDRSGGSSRLDNSGSRSIGGRFLSSSGNIDGSSGGNNDRGRGSGRDDNCRGSRSRSRSIILFVIAAGGSTARVDIRAGDGVSAGLNIGGLVDIDLDSSISALIATRELHTGRLSASSAGDLEIRAERVELSSILGECGVESQKFVAEDVVSSGDVGGDRESDRVVVGNDLVRSPDSGGGKSLVMDLEKGEGSGIDGRAVSVAVGEILV